MYLDGQGASNAEIELWIKILAAELASTDTIIELLAENEDQADKYSALFDKRRKDYFLTIFESLYERHGTVKIEDIMGDKNGL